MHKELATIAELLEGRIPSDFKASSLYPTWEQRYQAEDNPEDEFGADHYQAVGLDVTPYASVFLDEEGQMGGEIFDEISDAYRVGHWYPKGTPDHIATELRFLALLLQEGRDEEAGQFLSSQILIWLPVFCTALKGTENPFFSYLAGYLLEITEKLYQKLKPEPFHPKLPEIDKEFINDTETGLKEIAKYLLTPALSGCYLTQYRLKKLASQIDVPFGFGTRSQMLPSLIFAAIDYDKTKDLLIGLDQILNEWITELEKLAIPSSVDWVARIKQSSSLLAKIQAQV